MASTGKFLRENLPPARAFYQREIGKLARPNSRGWALGRPPCHESRTGRSFAVNLTTGAWCCHAGCGKGGDLVSFVRWRYNLNFANACRELGCWDETATMSRSEIRRQRRARAQQQAEAEAQIERQRQARIEARDRLHLLERVNRDANVRLSEIRKGAPEKYAGEAEVLWSILADSLDLSRTAAMEYAQLAGVPAAL